MDFAVISYIVGKKSEWGVCHFWWGQMVTSVQSVVKLSISSFTTFKTSKTFGSNNLCTSSSFLKWENFFIIIM